MKTLLTISFLAILSTSFAQNTAQAPRSEFAISLSESNLSLKPGESKEVRVTIAKSRSFANGNVTLASSTTLPAGISISYEPTLGNFDSSVATITASPSAAPGTFQLVLNGTMRNKTKGSILTLIVGGEEVAAKH